MFKQDFLFTTNNNDCYTVSTLFLYPIILKCALGLNYFPHFSFRTGAWSLRLTSMTSQSQYCCFSFRGVVLVTQTDLHDITESILLLLFQGGLVGRCPSGQSHPFVLPTLAGDSALLGPVHCGHQRVSSCHASPGCHGDTGM